MPAIQYILLKGVVLDSSQALEPLLSDTSETGRSWIDHSAPFSHGVYTLGFVKMDLAETYKKLVIRLISGLAYSKEGWRRLMLYKISIKSIPEV